MTTTSMKAACTVLALVFLSPAVGCGGSDLGAGTQVSDAEICSFRVGVTRSREVIDLLGPAQSSIAFGETLVITYHYQLLSERRDELVEFEFKRDVLSDVSTATVGSPTPRVVPSCIREVTP